MAAERLVEHFTRPVLRRNFARASIPLSSTGLKRLVLWRKMCVIEGLEAFGDSKSNTVSYHEREIRVKSRWFYHNFSLISRAAHQNTCERINNGAQPCAIPRPCLPRTVCVLIDPSSLRFVHRFSFSTYTCNSDSWTLCGHSVAQHDSIGRNEWFQNLRKRFR